MKRPNAKLKALLILFTTIVFSSCRDAEPVAQPHYDIELGDEITRTITGEVLDPQGLPVVNANVEMFGKQTTTNEHGFFYFLEETVFENHGYVTVHKQGYFLGSRAFTPTSGVNKVVIQLLERREVATLSSASGGLVEFEGVKIDMGAGFEYESGVAYEGDVHVFAKYIDPLGKNLNEEMPGNLRGVGPEGETGLATYGMIAVELTDENGNKLEPKKGNLAELTMPIPAGMQFISPKTIPLWHFDEEGGYWVEDGEAEKINNTFVGTVSHFSFWNWDIKIDAARSFGRIVTEGSVPITDAIVVLNTPGAGTRSGRTSSGGTFAGIMPVNVPAKLTISGGTFKVSDYTLELTIPSSGQIGDIVVPRSFLSLPTQVTGRIVDCDGMPIAKSIILVDQKQVVMMENGSLKTFLDPNENYNILALENTGSLLRSKLIWTIPDSSSFRAKDIILCPDQEDDDTSSDGDGLKEFSAKYTIDGVTHVIEEGFDIKKDLILGRFTLKLGGAAFGSTNSQYIIVKIKEGYHAVASRPGGKTYIFTPGTQDEIAFTTNLNINSPIVPDKISFTVFEDDLSPGGRGRMTFSGKFTEFNPQTGIFETRELEDGIITYEMN